jgi:endonuclease G
MNIAVPDAFYKIIIRESDTPDAPIVLAFIYPHTIPQSDNKKKSSSKGYPHEKYLVSIAEIERLAGLNFFTSLSDSQQLSLEEAAALDIWDDPGEYNLLEN